MKLLQTFIFLFLFTFTISLAGNKAVASSLNYFQQVKPQQRADTTKNDTAKVKNTLKKSSLDDKLEYFAADSTNLDKKNGIMYLYGKARVIYQTFELDADYIRFNSKKNTIYARGVKDSKGRYVGRPIFKMGNEGSSIADSLIYNTKTGKGLISGVFAEQEGGFFSGGKTKVQPDKELHVSGTTYSTCNLPEPHFGIHITKGIATENQIITGPVYMEFEGVPLPIAIPFAFFPKPNKKSSGIILPTPLEDQTRGFGLTGGGYYLALNDYWDFKALGSIFTNGSHDVNLVSNYIKRYKYTGNVNFGYNSVRNGLEGTPEYTPRKNFNIGWTHSQNANARPGTTFSASVNAGTSDFFTVGAANNTYDINTIAQNSLNSSITYGKVFGDGKFNLAVGLRHSQETQNKTISLTLPDVSLNMSTLNPFDDKVGVQRGFEKITVGYSFQASNAVNTKENLLFQKDGLRRFKNGFQHNIPISLPFNLFQYLNFNTSVNYSERWYLQTINQRMIRRAQGDSTAIDTVNGFKRAGEYNLSMGMSTKLYATKQFKNLGKIKAIRHVVTPTLSFAYKPDFAKDSYGYYKDRKYYTDDIRPGRSVPTGEFLRDLQGNIQKYSIFEQGIYGGPSAGEQASIGFSVDNNVELKVRSDKDTTGTGEKKIPIIQGLTFTSSYNFLAIDKKYLSPINFGGRSQFTDKLGFNFSGIFNPYAVENITTTTGSGINQISTTSLQEVPRFIWNDGKLPRLTNFTFSFDYSLNPDALKRRNENVDAMNQQNQMQSQVRTAEQNDALAAISRDPNAFVDFNIPWNLAFSYSFNYTNPLGERLTRNVSNTLNFNGDVNLTTKWKVQFNSGYDFKANNIAFTSFAIYRDLHCWDLSASWVPFGAYQSYSIDIKVKASVLQDLKLSKRKAYYTRN